MLTLWVKLQEQKVFYSYSVLYRSPSQSRGEFENFLSKFKVLVKVISNQKGPISIIICGFNAWSSNWCKYDISNNDGVQIDSVTSTHGLEQLIYEPTHILSNFSSCFDLIFTVQPNSMVDSGTHPLFTLIVAIKLFTVRLISKLNIHHLVKVMFGIMLKLLRIPYYLHCKMLIGIICLLTRLFINNWIC